MSSWRIDFKLGFTCNNRCRFCVQGDKRDRIPSRTTEEALGLLDDAREHTDRLVFTGGEVTVRKDLVQLVRRAAELGFKEIALQSNGRAFSIPKYVRRLIEAGVTEFQPALHGATAATHDALTRAPGSFEQTAKGIAIIKRLGSRVIMNTVITRPNYRELPALGNMLVRLGVDQYQLAFVHALGSAAQNFEEIVPRLSDVEPYVKAGLDPGIMAGIFVCTEAVPYCFMRGYEGAVVEPSIPKTRIYDGDQVVEDYTAYRWDEGKVKGEPCRACAMTDQCEGPWREYPEHFGWDEFRPIEAKPEDEPNDEPDDDQRGE